MQSGTLLYSTMELFTPDELSERTKAVLLSSGCNYETLVIESKFMQCVQNIDPYLLLAATDQYANNLILRDHPLANELNPVFQLVLDGIEFKETIKSSISNKRFKSLKMLCGFN